MHLLNRASVTKPECLDNYSYTSDHTWGDLTKPDKESIRLQLYKMQSQSLDAASNPVGLRCAYCESLIILKPSDNDDTEEIEETDQKKFDGHIEHFRRKNPAHYPQLTFEWSNLFFSCDERTHCGHYKDRPDADPYNPDELIKPDEHNPDEYLYFHSTGVVRVHSRSNMTDAERRLGSETIRVFNLNDGPLKGSRYSAAKKYLQANPGILEELMSWTAKDRQDYIEQEIEATKWEPYSTTIRHLLK